MDGKSDVTAIALLDDQLFVTRDGVARVSVYNATSFEMLRQLTFTGLGTLLRGLATSRPTAAHRHLYISDYNNDCIHRVDLAIAGADTLIKWNVADRSNGLSVNGAGNILVAYNYGRKVQEYTPTGSLLREISDSHNLIQAVELSSGVLAVTRHSLHSGVFAISVATQLKHIYYSGPGGSGAGQMYNPLSLTGDKHSYILVADDRNNRILVIGQLLTDARFRFLSTLNCSIRSRSTWIGHVVDCTSENTMVGTDCWHSITSQTSAHCSTIELKRVG